MTERLTLPTTPISNTPVVEVKSTTGGSVSAPVLALVDSNTGLYSSQSGKVDFTVQGSNVISVSSAGLLFNNATASYVPNSLNYYEEWSSTATFGGAISSTTVPISIVRVGKHCTLRIPAVYNTWIALDFIYTTVGIPLRFRPSIIATGICVIERDGPNVRFVSHIKLFTDGTITIYNGNPGLFEHEKTFGNPTQTTNSGMVYGAYINYIV